MVLFGVVYPLLITGIAMLTAPNDGDGQTVEVNGKVAGFEIIGQSFTSDKYFHGRPSAVEYNAAATGGSNKGPTNPDYLQLVEQRIKEFLETNPGIERKNVPVDLVTASGGGLDPHISPAAALIQVRRIAGVRGIQEEVLIRLINDHREAPLLNLFGTERVNVLHLNIALDHMNNK